MVPCRRVSATVRSQSSRNAFCWARLPNVRPLRALAWAYLTAGLDLALVPRHRRLRGQHHGAVVLAENPELGVEFRIEPIRLEHRRLEVVHDQGGGHAEERPEGVLQATDERLGVLAPDDLAVGLARVAEHNAEQVRPPSPAALLRDPGSLAEVHLHLRSRLALHPPERQRVDLHQSANVAFDRAVGAEKTMIPDQVLVDALDRQTALHRRLDHRSQRRAKARRTATRADGRVTGWFWRRITLGAVGRVAGWF